MTPIDTVKALVEALEGALPYVNPRHHVQTYRFGSAALEAGRALLSQMQRTPQAPAPAAVMPPAVPTEPNTELQELAHRIKHLGREIFEPCSQETRDAIEWFAAELSVSSLSSSAHLIQPKPAEPLTGFGKIVGTYGKVEKWPELPAEPLLSDEEIEDIARTIHITEEARDFNRLFARAVLSRIGKQQESEKP